MAAIKPEIHIHRLRKMVDYDTLARHMFCGTGKSKKPIRIMHLLSGRRRSNVVTAEPEISTSELEEDLTRNKQKLRDCIDILRVYS
jgi:hypothetical protein